MPETETKPLDADLAQSTGVLNPLVLLDRMIEKGVDPDALKKMMDLQERWEKNQAVKAFNSAMVACQRAMPTVVKDAENKHTKSRYALRETVQRAIKPVYTEHGFSLSFSTEDCPREGHIRILCEVGHEGGDIRTKQFDIPLDGEGSKGNASAMNKPQATGSTYSYGCRYATLAVFNVVIAGEDDDAQGKRLALTSGQIQSLNAFIDQWQKYDAQAAAAKIQHVPYKADKFFAVFECKSMDEMTNAHFDKAVDILSRRTEAARKLVEGQA